MTTAEFNAHVRIAQLLACNADSLLLK